MYQNQYRLYTLSLSFKRCWVYWYFLYMTEINLLAILCQHGLSGESRPSAAHRFAEPAKKLHQP